MDRIRGNIFIDLSDHERDPFWDDVDDLDDLDGDDDNEEDYDDDDDDDDESYFGG